MFRIGSLLSEFQAHLEKRFPSERRVGEARRARLRDLRFAEGRPADSIRTFLAGQDPRIVDAVEARLGTLRRRREILAALPTIDPRFDEEAAALQREYPLLDELIRALWKLERWTRAAEPWIAEAMASGGYVETAPGKRNRGERLFTPEELAALPARRAELDERREALLGTLPDEGAEELLQSHIEPLRKKYEGLYNRSYGMWRRLYPLRAEASRKTAAADLRALLKRGKELAGGYEPHSTPIPPSDP